MHHSLDFAVLPRHCHLVSSFFADIKPFFVQGKLYPIQDRCRLVYGGERYSGEEELIDVTIFDTDFSFDDVEDYLMSRDKIQPDFAYFSTNKFVQNRTTILTAGIPNFVVEVWSIIDMDYDRNHKFRIYSSSDSCEHWYLEDRGEVIHCWKGKSRLPDQHISNLLRTTDNIVFDLRHLVLTEKERIKYATDGN